MEEQNQNQNFNTNQTNEHDPGKVAFEDAYNAQYLPPEPSLMTKLIFKISGGMIKDERQATYVLTALAILFFALAIYIFSSGSN